MGSEPERQLDEPLDRRRFVRFAVSLSVIGRARQFVGKELRGRVRNISAGGLMAEFPVEVVPRSTMALVLQSRRGPLEVEGKVMWTSATACKIRHGLAFPERKGPHFMDLVVAKNG